MCEGQEFLTLNDGTAFKIIRKAGTDDDGPYNPKLYERKGVEFKVSYGIRLYCPKCSVAYIVESPPTPEAFKRAFISAGGKGDPGSP